MSMQGEDRPGWWSAHLVDTQQHLDTGFGHQAGDEGVDDWQLGEDQPGTLPTLLHCTRSLPAESSPAPSVSCAKVEKSRVKGLLQTSREEIYSFNTD